MELKIKHMRPSKNSDEQYLTSIVKNVEFNENLNLRLSPTPALNFLFNDLHQQPTQQG